MTAMTKNTIRIVLIDDHKSFMEGLAMVINSQTRAMEVVGMAGNRIEAEPDEVFAYVPKSIAGRAESLGGAARVERLAGHTKVLVEIPL